MSITSLALNRPITTLMVFSATLIFGLISVFHVPVDLLPDVNLPVITIETRIGGYSPEEVETTVTKPIEAVVSMLNGVKFVSSTSREGLSIVKIGYRLGTDMDYAAAEVREKIDLIRDQFPRDVQRPLIRKYNPSDAPAMVIAVHGMADPASLRDMVEQTMEKRLRRIKGVGNVEVKGGRKREIVVELDEGRLKALGISVRQVGEALKENNLDMEVGSIEAGKKELVVREVGTFKTLSQISNTPILRTGDGSIVYLHDIGIVREAFGKRLNIMRFQGKPRVMVYIQKESGVNILNLTKSVSHELDQIKRLLRGKARIKVIYNQAEFINKAIVRLRDEALLGGLLALGVIFIFLRNIQSVLVIATAIPISIITTFTLMYVLGITINIISLAGFTLGIGMLVDNSIVVIENIFRKRQVAVKGTVPAAEGAQEVLGPISVSTFAHIAVFLPIIFLQKKIRMFYSSLFFTVSFSLLVSLVVALTIIPLFSKHLSLRPAWGTGQAWWLRNLYRRTLLRAMRRRSWVLGGSVALFAGALGLLPAIGFEPSTSVDQGQFEVIVRTPPGSSLQGTDRLAQIAERILLGIPEVKDVSTEVKRETASLRVRLVDEKNRKRSTRDIVASVRPILMRLPRCRIHFNVERGRLSGKELILRVSGPEEKVLIGLAFEIEKKLKGLREIEDIVIHQSNPEPQLQIKVLHDKAGMFGLDATDIAHAVRSALTGPLVTDYLKEDKQLYVRMRLLKGYVRNVTALSNLLIPVRSSLKRDVYVPLKEICIFRFTRATSEIHRRDRKRVIELSAEIGTSRLAQVASHVSEVLSDIQFPEQYKYEFGENYFEMKKSKKEMLFAFVLAVLLVYMILASFFESFILPFIIMFSVPLSIMGSLLTLFVFGKPISIPVYVGAITLAGIVVNNAVVLVDYTRLLRDKGVGSIRSALKAGEMRLRPILMTSSTTLVAMLPMAMAKGEGAALWSPLALTIIGGLLSSTLLTLIVLPILCASLDQG